MLRHRSSLALSLSCLALSTLPVHGQNTAPSANTPSSTSRGIPGLFNTNVNLEGSISDKGAALGLGTSPKTEDTPKAKKQKRHGEFAVAPIPMINPTIGNGGGLGAIYAVHLGEAADTSPPSALGIGGFATGRGSWALGLGGRLNLRNDRYRITVAGGGGEFVYNFFGIGTNAGNAGISIVLSQRSRAFLIEPKMQVFPHWYIGPRYHLIKNDVALGSSKFDPNNLPIPLPSDVNFKTAALGLRVQRDTSDNLFYPYTGSILDLTADFFAPAFGGDRTYQGITLSYDKYLHIAPKEVIAVHGSLCTASDQAPFFDLCQLGMSKDLRGYQVGEYRDFRMLVGQVEYRRELFWRLGATAFAGAGAVGKSFDDMGDAQPGGGFGLRFVLAKRNHINLRADFAWGNSSRATYISLGEAF